MQNEIVTASIFKRVGAAVLDAILIFIFIVLMQSWVVVPIADACFGYSDTQQEYRDKLVESGMYVEYSSSGNDSEKAVYPITAAALYDATTGKDNLNDRTCSAFDYYEPFFSTFVASPYGQYNIAGKGETEESFSEEFIRAKSEAENLFVLSGETYVPVEGATNEKLAEFYVNQYDNFVGVALYNVNGEIYSLALEINNISIWGLIITGTLAFVIFSLVIPLCRKNGETIGKMIVGSAVVSRKDGFRVRKTQTLIRFVSFFFLEIVLSVMLGNFALILVMLPLLASFTFVIFSKSHCAFHDYFAATVVIDKNKCIVYKNAEELNEHLLQLKAIEEQDVYRVKDKDNDPEVFESGAFTQSASEEGAETDKDS